MVVEALRGYVQLASGLTEVTRARAREAARALVEHAEGLTGRQGGDAAAQVKSLADDLASSARSNRDLLLSMIRAEVERAVAGLGVATKDDLAEIRRRLAALEVTPPTATTPAKSAAANKAAAAKIASAKTAPAKKTAPARKTTAAPATDEAAGSPVVVTKRVVRPRTLAVGADSSPDGA